MHLKLKTNMRNMIGLAAVTTVLCFVLITGISLHSLKSTIDQDSEHITELIASRIYDAINDRLMSSIVTSRTMANDDFLQQQLLQESSLSDADTLAQMTSYLTLIRNNMGYDTAYVISAQSRKYFIPNGLNKLVSPETDAHDRWYTNFLQGQKKVDFDVDTDEANVGRWTVFTNARIEQPDGRLLGVCGVGLAMDDIQYILKGFEEQYDVKVNLVNPQGIVQIDTDSINIENAILDVAMPAASTDTDQYTFQRLDNGSYTITKYIDNFGWYLVVRSSGRQQQQAVNSLLRRNVTVMTAILTALIIVIHLMMFRERRRLRHIVMNDELTGLPNRKFFVYGYDEQAYQVLAMFDIDYFKQINDQQGHPAGDKILQYVAQTTRRLLPKQDEIIRWGGDEFLLLFPEDLSTAAEQCQQLQETFHNEGKITISLGLCPMGADLPDSIGNADIALYEAKSNGRNTIVIKQ